MTKVFTQSEVYNRAVDIAFTTASGAIRGAFVGSSLAGLGHVYVQWMGDLCVRGYPSRDWVLLAGATVVLPVAGALVGATCAAVIATGRILKN